MASSPTRPTRDVTRDDVARLAGVSSAVVSYVVNNGPRPVADATRRRVQEAIEKLGYRPNAAARALTTGRSDLLGLIVPDLSNPYFAALAAGRRRLRPRSRGSAWCSPRAQSEDLPDAGRVAQRTARRRHHHGHPAHRVTLPRSSCATGCRW